MEPNGCLPFKSEPQPGDKLILFPVYVYPVEVLERGLFVRPSYDYYVALVNAFNKKTELLEVEKLAVDTSFDASGFECQRLEVKVTPQLAEALAEYGAVPEDFRRWRRVVRSRKIALRTENVQLVWHVYAVRGSEAIDTFTGDIAPSAGMIDLLFAPGSNL